MLQSRPALTAADLHRDLRQVQLRRRRIRPRLCRCILVARLCSHPLAGCGVAVHADGARIASGPHNACPRPVTVAGDLSGQVLVWRVGLGAPVARQQLAAPVRSLAWLPGDVLAIGCMSGAVHCWQLQSHHVTPALDLGAAVTALRPAADPMLLAAATVVRSTHTHCRRHARQMGELVLMRVSGAQLRVVHRMQAHPPVPGPQQPLFGQLAQHAEVWGLCWAPDHARIATCSEDQATRIWQLRAHAPPVLTAVLTGHTLAVTAVDWQRRCDGTEVLATCSDDRRVLLYDGTTFAALGELSTASVPGWHTITYLTLQHVARTVLVVTQHGYMVAWRLSSTAPLSAAERMRRRVHLASVEGLHGAAHVLASVAADGTVRATRLTADLWDDAPPLG